MAYRLTIALLCGLGLAARPGGAADRDPNDVLKRVAEKVLDAGGRMPNYTCVETVERRNFRPLAPSLPRACPVIVQQLQSPTLDLKPQLYSVDRLRLDVTMAEHGEIFSWAGASKFDDAGIDHLVRAGPMGTGAFGAYLLAVFRGESSARFLFTRRVTEGGRSLMEFTYRVPLSGSHYKVKTLDDAWVYTAFGGTILADPETGDVVRLVVQTDELPESAGSCFSTSTMDFASVRIGVSQVRLATHLLQRWISPNGNEAENSTSFANCREYTGESTLTFLPEESARPAASAAKAEAPPSAIPEGLRFALVLSLPIQTDAAAAGDRFVGVLADALRGAKSKVLAPKGAVVEGRLLRVETFERPPQVFVVMRPRTVEVNGVKLPLAAGLDWQSAATVNRDALKRRVSIYLPQPGEEQSGVFRFSGQHVTVPKGFRSEWRTVGAN
jgi:hypothetical protein